MGTAGNELDRAIQALARIEQAAPLAAMRRTGAEPSDSAEQEKLRAEVSRLQAENDSLREQLSRSGSGDDSIRREAARLAQQVDRALEQLDLIEKG